MTRIFSILFSLLFTTAALAETADLRIVAQGNKNLNTFSVLFAILNEGPDPAHKAVVTIDLPAGVTASRASVGSDTVIECDATQRPVRCELGDMHTGAPFYYGGIDIHTPIADATYSMTVHLASETPDPNPANNEQTITWQTKIEAEIGVFIAPQTYHTDPGGTGQFNVYVCNNQQENKPAAVRADFTATNGVITAITPAPGFSCTIDGATAVCTTAAMPFGCPKGVFKVDVRASDDRKGGEARLTVRGSSDLPERNPANDQDSKAFGVYRWISVNSVADAGPGSLRDAIDQANAGCSPGPCRIVFEIPAPVPAEGWFTITPSSELPAITADRVTLEGSRQTALTGDTNPNGPEVAIDGRFAHRGLKVLSACEGVVEGLAIGNFDEDQGLWLAANGGVANRCGFNPDLRQVIGNHIGVDPSGTVPWPNLRGLRADFAYFLTVQSNVISNNRLSGIWMWRGGASFTKNRIENNGASGIFLGPEVNPAEILYNTISGQRQMGVAVARTAKIVDIRLNAMKDNGGLGIDWGLDDVSPVDADDKNGPSNAPTLLSARYDAAANSTIITLTVKSSPLGAFFNTGVLDFYSNAKPDGDGETWVWTASDTTTARISGDHRGEWINATWTRVHWEGSRNPGDPSTEFYAGGDAMTSELSNAVLVQ